MSVIVAINVGEFPKGNPGSLGEPLGIWNAQAAITGDASGGFVALQLRPQNPISTPGAADHRRQYAYFVDGVHLTSEAAMNHSVSIFMHMERSNNALANPFSYVRVRPAIDDGRGIFIAGGPLFEEQVSRMAVWWEAQELIAEEFIMQLIWETNVDLDSYRGEAYGRYYDRQIVGNRGFGRLIAPPAISQFEG